jgi:segregation and condensation protein A
MTFAPNIALNNFEGPLDLLLYLIQKEEIDIYDIPLHEMTRNFLIALIEESDRKLDIGAEFIGGTSFLLLLKSKRLLPKEVNQEESSEDKTLLVLKDLIEYCTFKEIAKRLSIIEEKNNGHFERGLNSSSDTPPILALNEYSINDLSKILNALLSKKPKEIQILKDEGFKVEERLEFLRKSFKESFVLFFDDLFSIDKSKDELIATFLAVLQLVKGQELKIKTIDNRVQFSYGTSTDGN